MSLRIDGLVMIMTTNMYEMNQILAYAIFI